ncbi:DUF305 domain-containing protein [Rhodococcus sp. W8901]|nr:DUF305 domain-containing protein [Rhodococcus sp. W8901]
MTTSRLASRPRFFVRARSRRALAVAAAAAIRRRAGARTPRSLFLQLMERHHRGGIAMAQAADRNSPTDR